MPNTIGLSELTGNWRGSGTLFTPWTTPAEQAYDSSVFISQVARNILKLEYTWEADGKQQDGLMLVSENKKDGSFSAVWVDSWHQSEGFLLSKGSRAASGDISVLGSYPAPTGPDWGWKTIIRALGDDHLELLMYNISPEGKEEIAVHNTYRRG
jgi:hypothetical protein